MDRSLIKALIFCTACYGLLGEVSMASPLGDEFTVPELANSSRGDKVLQESADLLQESEALLHEGAALLDSSDSALDGKAVLETVAYSGDAMKRSKQVPLEDIKVGAF